MKPYTTIISPPSLFAHLNDPSWAIVDCRFDLKNADWGEQAYQQGHIPGAVYAHLDRDLSLPKSPTSGRHPLPPVEQIAAQFSAWGIANQTQVVVYDQVGGAFAARLWWMLRFLGHQGVAVLDGGLPAWQNAGYPLVGGVETRSPTEFKPQPDWSMLVSTEEVERLRTNPDYRLVDARAAERFRGEVEPIDPVAGHIPGAVNRFHGENLSPTGQFLPPETLHEQFSALLGPIATTNTIVYCGSGVTSCHHLIALEQAGLPGARLYLGSWSEWITDPARPRS
jgi:thiosulfate/3-mercaptopyruvate sulfurtransferase